MFNLHKYLKRNCSSDFLDIDKDTKRLNSASSAIFSFSLSPLHPL